MATFTTLQGMFVDALNDALVGAEKAGRGGIAVPLAEHGEFPRLGSIVDRAMQADAAVDLLPVNLSFLTRVSKLSAAKARHGVAHIRFTKSGRATQDRPEMVVLDFGDEGSTRVVVMAARVDR